MHRTSTVVKGLEMTISESVWENKYLIYSPILLVLPIVLIISVLYPEHGIDVYVFYDYAIKIHDGMVPYKDFVVEFPQCALIFYYLPCIFTTDQATYITLFAIEVAIFTALTYYVTIKLFDLLQISAYKKMVMATAFTIFLCAYFVSFSTKFDIFVIFFTLLSIYFFSMKKYTLAYAILAFATLVKFYPGLIFPVFIFCNLFMSDRAEGLRTILRGLSVAAVIVIVSALPFLIAGATVSDMFSWLEFHSDRGFQIESTVAIIAQFLSYFGLWSYTLVDKYNTEDVISPLTDALSGVWMYAVVLMLAIAIILIFIFLRRNGMGESIQDRAYIVAISATLLLTLFMTTNKVFSTQYLAWLIPLIWVYGALRSDRFMLQISALFAVILLLSLYRDKEFLTVVFHVAFMIRAVLLSFLILHLSSELLYGGYRDGDDGRYWGRFGPLALRRPGTASQEERSFLYLERMLPESQTGCDGRYRGPPEGDVHRRTEDGHAYHIGSQVTEGVHRTVYHVGVPGDDIGHALHYLPDPPETERYQEQDRDEPFATAERRMGGESGIHQTQYHEDHARHDERREDMRHISPPAQIQIQSGAQGEHIEVHVEVDDRDEPIGQGEYPRQAEDGQNRRDQRPEETCGLQVLQGMAGPYTGVPAEGDGCEDGHEGYGAEDQHQLGIPALNRILSGVHWRTSLPDLRMRYLLDFMTFLTTMLVIAMMSNPARMQMTAYALLGISAPPRSSSKYSMTNPGMSIPSPAKGQRLNVSAQLNEASNRAAMT